MHGTGTYHYQDGSTYTGDYADGKRHGIGVLQEVNGAKYKGGW
jgi:hypothetical protein